MKKPTTAQLGVLRQMQEGLRLVRDTTFAGGWFLVGRDRRWTRVHSGTAHTLVARGWIFPAPKGRNTAWYEAPYQLTRVGREASK